MSSFYSISCVNNLLCETNTHDIFQGQDLIKVHSRKTQLGAWTLTNDETWSYLVRQSGLAHLQGCIY